VRIREYVLDIFFELFFTDGAKKVIWAGLGFLDNFRVLFFIGLFAIQVFQVFNVLVLEKVIVFRRIMSFICQGEERGTKWSIFVEMWKIILANKKLTPKESFQLVLRGWTIYEEIMILFGIYFIFSN
jgi:hypothetical protein